MRPSKIDDDQLLERLGATFRAHGFEGASLSRLVAATGLQRASLYHRFPGGKEQMVEAVLGASDRWLDDHVLTPLAGPGEASARAAAMSEKLEEFYAGGERSCLLDALSLGDRDNVRRHVERSCEAWLAAMATVSRDAGFAEDEARRRAEDALVAVQGALVLSRVTGDREPFQRVLGRLPSLLTG